MLVDRIYKKVGGGWPVPPPDPAMRETCHQPCAQKRVAMFPVIRFIKHVTSSDPLFSEASVAAIVFNSLGIAFVYGGSQARIMFKLKSKVFGVRVM